MAKTPPKVTGAVPEEDALELVLLLDADDVEEDDDVEDDDVEDDDVEEDDAVVLPDEVPPREVDALDELLEDDDELALSPPEELELPAPEDVEVDDDGDAPAPSAQNPASQCCSSAQSRLLLHWRTHRPSLRTSPSEHSIHDVSATPNAVHNSAAWSARWLMTASLGSIP